MVLNVFGYYYVVRFGPPANAIWEVCLCNVQESKFKSYSPYLFWGFTEFIGSTLLSLAE